MKGLQHPKVSEAEFQEFVIDFAELHQWRVWHIADSRRQVRPGVFVGDTRFAGFPDLTMVRGQRLIFAELKSETGRIRPAQRQTLDLLRAVPGVQAGIWRPSDWPDLELLLR